MLWCLFFLEAEYDASLLAVHVPAVENGATNSISRNNLPLFFDFLLQAYQRSLQGARQPWEPPDPRQTLDLRRLQDLARDLINNSLALSTRRVYASGQRCYLEFCRKGSLSPFPLSEDQLCTFVAYLMDGRLQHFAKGVSVINKETAVSNGVWRPICILSTIVGIYVSICSLLTIVGIYTQRDKTASSERQEVTGKKHLTITPDILRKLRGVE